MLVSQPKPENGKSPYFDIAEKYNVSLSTVKSWATRHWKVAAKGEKLQPQPEKVATLQPFSIVLSNWVLLHVLK